MKSNFPKLATPISHLFSNDENVQKIIKASDCLECRDRSIDQTYSNQEVFHCDLQPIHYMGTDELKYLQKIKKIKRTLN